jgi:heterodisulfide reductase subunit A
MTAVHNAILLKKKKPALNITILYRDIPSEPGPDRNTLDKANKLGIKFLRFAENNPPCVNSSVVSVNSFEDQPFELPYDLVILSTPMIPHESSRTLASAFRIPVDQFRFIPDTLPNLKPHQYTEPCVHVVGSAHWPCTVSEATYQAYGRTAHIASLIKKQEVFSTRAITSVDFDTCRGCSTCLEWCPFDVPVITNGTGGVLVSHIDPFLCKGCGSCVVHCPSGAATLQNLEDETLYSTIEAVLIDREWSSVKTIAFLCEWSGYAAADLAGISRRNLPGEVIPIRIPCAGRVSTGLILHAFTFGADGVLICACEEGDCHYLSGNTNCAAVAIDTENILGLLGIEKERFQMAHVSAVDVEAFSKTLEDFIATIKKLEPSVFRLTYVEEEL